MFGDRFLLYSLLILMQIGNSHLLYILTFSVSFFLLLNWAISEQTVLNAFWSVINILESSTSLNVSYLSKTVSKSIQNIFLTPWDNKINSKRYKGQQLYLSVNSPVRIGDGQFQELSVVLEESTSDDDDDYISNPVFRRELTLQSEYFSRHISGSQQINKGAEKSPEMLSLLETFYSFKKKTVSTYDVPANSSDKKIDKQNAVEDPFPRFFTPECMDLASLGKLKSERLSSKRKLIHQSGTSEMFSIEKQGKNKSFRNLVPANHSKESSTSSALQPQRFDENLQEIVGTKEVSAYIDASKKSKIRTKKDGGSKHMNLKVSQPKSEKVIPPNENSRHSRMTVKGHKSRTQEFQSQTTEKIGIEKKLVSPDSCEKTEQASELCKHSSCVHSRMVKETKFKSQACLCDVSGHHDDVKHLSCQILSECKEDAAFLKFKEDKTLSGLSSLKSQIKSPSVLEKSLVDSCCFDDDKLAKREYSPKLRYDKKINSVRSSSNSDDRARYSRTATQAVSLRDKDVMTTPDLLKKGAFAFLTDRSMMTSPLALKADGSALRSKDCPPKEQLDFSDKSVMTSPSIIWKRFLATHILKICTDSEMLKTVLKSVDTNSSLDSSDDNFRSLISGIAIDSIGSGDPASSLTTKFKSDISTLSSLPPELHSSEVILNRNIAHNSRFLKTSQKRATSSGGHDSDAAKILSPKSHASTSEWSFELSYSLEN